MLDVELQQAIKQIFIEGKRVKIIPKHLLNVDVAEELQGKLCIFKDNESNYVRIGGKGGEYSFVENSCIDVLLVPDFHLDMPNEDVEVC
jgi:hypothetical protein